MIAVFESGKPPVTLTRDSEPSLEWMQKMVGGYIEVPCKWHMDDGTPIQVVVNEEALILKLPINVAATQWLETHAPPGHMPHMFGGYIRGTMLVLLGPACMT
jgi:hypothetical protein